MKKRSEDRQKSKTCKLEIGPLPPSASLWDIEATSAKYAADNAEQFRRQCPKHCQGCKERLAAKMRETLQALARQAQLS